jgi:hypothetical protein
VSAGLWIKKQLFFVKLLAIVFYENWLRWPRRGGTLVLDLDKYSVRVEPEEDEPRTPPLTEGYVVKGGHNTFPSQIKERPAAPGAMYPCKKGSDPQ